MTKHTQGYRRGQFITGSASQTDTVDALSGDPQGEHQRPGDATVYPEHDYRYGRVMHLLPHRQQRVINGQTGEVLFEHITDVRAIQARPYGRTATHVVETDGVPFLGTAPPQDTLSGYRKVPGTGKRLPSMYQYEDAGD